MGSWPGCRAGPTRLRTSTRAIELSLAVASSLACALSIIGAPTGVFNVYGWASAALFLALAGSFVYLRGR